MSAVGAAAQLDARRASRRRRTCTSPRTARRWRSHAAVAFAAAIAVTFPLSHVASEPPVTIAASTLTVKPGSSSASALP